MSVSSTVIEIEILLIGQILDHFVCHPVETSGNHTHEFLNFSLLKSWYLLFCPSHIHSRQDSKPFHQLLPCVIISESWM
jgi:hypothetical protein